LLELETVLTEFVENNETRFVFNNFLPKIVSFMRSCGEI